MATLPEAAVNAPRLSSLIWRPAGYGERNLPTKKNQREDYLSCNRTRTTSDQCNLAKARHIRGNKPDGCTRECICWGTHRQPDTLPLRNLLTTCKTSISVANKPRTSLKHRCSKGVEIKSSAVLMTRASLGMKRQQEGTVLTDAQRCSQGSFIGLRRKGYLKQLLHLPLHPGTLTCTTNTYWLYIRIRRYLPFLQRFRTP